MFVQVLALKWKKKFNEIFLPIEKNTHLDEQRALQEEKNQV